MPQNVRNIIYNLNNVARALRRAHSRKICILWSFVRLPSHPPPTLSAQFNIIQCRLHCRGRRQFRANRVATGQCNSARTRRSGGGGVVGAGRKRNQRRKIYIFRPFSCTKCTSADCKLGLDRVRIRQQKPDRQRAASTEGRKEANTC